ncbi:MAG: hypothetical protein ACKVVP_06375 [Chloroflexota bacterium]
MQDLSSRLAGRMPWILLGIGGLAILAVIGTMIAGRRGDQLNVNVAAPPTGTPVVVSVPVTVVSTPLTVVVTATPGPPTVGLATAFPPPAAPKQAPPTLAPAAPAPAQPTAGTGSQVGAQVVPTVQVAPTELPRSSNPPPTAVPTAPAKPTTPPPPTPQPFRGEVSPSGGLANTRASLDSALGAPSGETPSRLVVYQRPPLEYQVLYSADPARTLLIVCRPLAAAPLTLDAARDAARRLVPNDAQMRTAQPEGNETFVVERFRSESLAQAIPAELLREWGGQAGDLVVIYQRSTSAPERIDRFIIAVGDNIDRARQRAGS